MESPNGNGLAKKLGIVAVVGLLVIAAAAYVMRDKIAQKVEEKTFVPSPTPARNVQSDSSSVAASAYKDGTYSTTSTYRTPGGNEDMGVTLMLKDGVITDVTVTVQARDHEARQYQEMFMGEYKPMVVGKKIDTVQLDRVSGSSLTSGGFNAALDAIMAQAKA